MDGLRGVFECDGIVGWAYAQGVPGQPLIVAQNEIH